MKSILAKFNENSGLIVGICLGLIIIIFMSMLWFACILAIKEHIYFGWFLTPVTVLMTIIVLGAANEMRKG